MFGIIKNFIKKDYLNNLKDEIKFNNDYVFINNTWIKEQRKTYWMSEYNYEYKYGCKIMKSNNLIDNIKVIQKIIEDNYNVHFDSVLINYYENGNIGMKYHSDEIYDEWSEESVIISFGAPKIIIFREINNYNNKTKFVMNSGDLIYMKNGCQKYFQHKVCKNNDKNDRISLVFKKHIS